MVLHPSSKPTQESSTGKEHRGTVLDVLAQLLAENRADEVLALFRKLVARNETLERRLAELTAGRRKNEGVSTAQLKLLFEELTSVGPEAVAAADEKLRAVSGLDEAKEKKAPPARRQPPLRRPISALLRRVDNPIPVPAEERTCPTCGTERRCIGHDVTEVVELIPAEVIVRVDRREKLVCDACEGELVRAPMGNKVVSGGRLGVRLVSEVVTDKYRDGLPLHRQKERLARLGFDVAISTLGDQVTWATELLRPLWHAAHDGVLAAEIMHLDGTSLPVLDRDSPGGKRLGALWGFVGGVVAFVCYASSSKKLGQHPGERGPEDILRERTGLVVADASNLFDASFRRPDLIECGCNMHARRYFHKTLDSGDRRAALPLAAFKKLYEIEAELRDVDPETRRLSRQKRSRLVYDELVCWAEVLRPLEPPSLPLGTALRYLHNHETALRRFLDDGRIPIDNGVVERLHVRTAIARKNFLFAGSDTGGERAAIAFTILSCCSLAEVNPVEYLADVLARLMRPIRLRDIPALLPHNWKAARTATASPTIALPAL